MLKQTIETANENEEFQKEEQEIKNQNIVNEQFIKDLEKPVEQLSNS